MQSLDETTPPIDKENTMTDANHVPVLDALAEVLKQRRHANPEDSYVASLHHKGLNTILEKVGEEATETILAAKEFEADPSAQQALIGETADLWFHTMVMLSHLDLSADDVLTELKRRFGTGGLEEKARRS